MAKPPFPGWSPQTRAVAAGRAQTTISKTVNPPIQRGSTVLLGSAGGFLEHSAANYGRSGLAAQDALREALQSFNLAAGAVLTPSGLSACTLALLTFAKPGGRILAPRSCYGPTRAFCQGMLRTLGVETIFYEPHIGAAIAALLDESTLCIYLESPGSLEPIQFNPSRSRHGRTCWRTPAA